eukprot:531201-Amphidinium_carterae.2
MQPNSLARQISSIPRCLDELAEQRRPSDTPCSGSWPSSSLHLHGFCTSADVSHPWLLYSDGSAEHAKTHHRYSLSDFRSSAHAGHLQDFNWENLLISKAGLGSLAAVSYYMWCGGVQRQDGGCNIILCWCVGVAVEARRWPTNVYRPFIHYELQEPNG